VDLTIFVVACGAGTGVGLAMLLRSWKARPTNERVARPRVRVPMSSSRLPLLGVCAVATGVAVGLLTGWPVAAVSAGLAAFAFPYFLRATRRSTSTARTEAVAAWTELLRDTLSAASGLSQAIVATAPLAPDAVKVPVITLATRIGNGVPLSEGLRMFADEMNDPSVDLVVCALTLAASARTQRVADLLGALAASMREEVVMRLRVESGRASARSGVRTIAIFSLSFVALLVVLARAYLAPFGSAEGQLVMAMACLFDGLGVLYMLRLVRDPQSERLLTPKKSVEALT
jgi:tight adherence protein B